MTPTSTSEPDILLDSLVQSAFATTAVLTRVGTRYDLSLTQMRVLAILRDHEPRIGDLAAHLGLDRSTLSGLVDRAVARGLVTRRAADADARVVEVALTAAGRTLADEVRAVVGDTLSPATSRLTRTERARLADLLQKTLADRHP